MHTRSELNLQSRDHETDTKLSHLAETKLWFDRWCLQANLQPRCSIECIKGGRRTSRVSRPPAKRIDKAFFPPFRLPRCQTPFCLRSTKNSSTSFIKVISVFFKVWALKNVLVEEEEEERLSRHRLLLANISFKQNVTYNVYQIGFYTNPLVAYIRSISTTTL